MAGPIQSAVSSTFSTAAAAIGLGKGLKMQEEKAEAEKVKAEAEQVKAAEKEAKLKEAELKAAQKQEEQLQANQRKAERENLQRDILQQRLDIERAKSKTAMLKQVQMQQRAKESYLGIIREKQLGTKMGTRTSMADYLIAASGGTLKRDQAREIASTMTDRQKRKVKEEGGAHGDK